MKNEIPFDKNVVEKTYDRLKPLFYRKSVTDKLKLNELLFRFARSQGELVGLGKILDEVGPVDEETDGMSNILLVYLGTLMLSGQLLIEIAHVADLEAFIGKGRI